MNELLIVGCGGFLGAISRFFITRLIQPQFPDFPAGTIFVNLLGSFLLGICLGYLLTTANHRAYLFLIVGALGSLTTFSALSMDALTMLQNGQIPQFAAYVFLQIFLGVGLTALGLSLGRAAFA